MKTLLQVKLYFCSHVESFFFFGFCHTNKILKKCKNKKGIEKC